MIAAFLTAAGYRVGLFTSPHLVDFNERIRIDGRNISDRSLIRLTDQFSAAIDKSGATFFEATTAMAFRYFADRRVDCAVIETGLGGRLDATNVLTPLVSIITSIGKDHTEILGTTYKKIAHEKGGIIKPGVPCVLGRMPSQAKKVLEALAAANSSPVIDVQHIAVDSLPDGSLSVQTPDNRYTSIKLSLKGGYQRDNAAAALAALDQLRKKGFDISSRAVHEGLRRVEELTGLQARLQVIRRRPLLVCDVAHNPDAVRVLADSIRLMPHARVHLILGVMKDKEYRPMIRTLAGLKPKFYAVEASIARSLPASALRDAIKREGYASEHFSTISTALAAARSSALPDDLILVTGSHYVVGEAMSAIRKSQHRRGRRKKN